MNPLFDGLDQFGIDDIKDANLFEEKEDDKKVHVRRKNVTEEVDPERLLYDRHLRCPVCENKFPVRTVKSGSAKLQGTTVTLRPIYKGIDMILYDIVSCSRCGYTAINRNFTKITDKQIKKIREQISVKFVAYEYPSVYDYAVAIKRYKLALYNDMVMGRTDVNKAYVCLKISWILESLIEEAKDDQVRQKLKEERKSFIDNAFIGFEKAYSGISFPIFGMNEATYHYLLGALSYERQDKKNTSFWLSKVLLASSGNKRLKEKARELKGLMDNL